MAVKNDDDRNYLQGCEETLNLLHSYYAHSPGADIDKYFSCFSSQGRFLGTDGTESWSMEDYRRYLEPFFSPEQKVAYLPYVPKADSRKFNAFPANSPNPSIVAFDELLEIEGIKAQARGTGSLIWNSDQNKWLIFSYHLSIPVPNEIARRVCDLTRSGQKK